MLGAGDRVADASVWTAPHERTTIQDIVREGPVLFLFYLFDWSST
jgi:hypothetical protein